MVKWFGRKDLVREVKASLKIIVRPKSRRGLGRIKKFILQHPNMSNKEVATACNVSRILVQRERNFLKCMKL